MKPQKDLGQIFTPPWAAELLFDAHYKDANEHSLVWEPTCGPGHMLAAIPKHIPALGTEVDPALAHQARINTGCDVITADFRTVPIWQYPVTHIFSNPPWQMALFVELLAVSAKLLKAGQYAGFIIPAYFFQTSRTVMALCRQWSIEQEIIPRDIFKGSIKPVVFAKFTRDEQPKLVGFRLFPQTAEIMDLPATSNQLLATSLNGRRSIWKAAVNTVLNELGGKADLQAIYQQIEGKRPTGTTWWKEKVRQILQRSFTRIDNGVYTNKK